MNINIFKESQRSLFDYYCTYFRLLPNHNVEFADHIKGRMLTILLLSDTLEEKTEIISSVGIKMQLKVMSPIRYSLGDISGLVTDLNIFAVFNESSLCECTKYQFIFREAVKDYGTKFLTGAKGNRLIWTYCYATPMNNLTPPLLPEHIKVKSIRDLKSYLLMFDNDESDIVLNKEIDLRMHRISNTLEIF